MKKKCLCILLLGCSLLAGCATEPESPAVGICYRDRDENALAPVLEQTLICRGWQVRWADADRDQWEQDRQVEELLDEGCSLLIVEPVMVTTARSTVEQLRQHGIAGIFLRNRPEDGVLESWDRVCFVGCDEAQPGALQGQILRGTSNAGDVNGDGVVSYVVLQGSEDDLDTQLRTQSCIRAMGAQSRCLSLCSCGRTVSGARAACARELMKQGSTVEAVFCGSESMVTGALQAIQNANKKPGKDIYLVGFGTAPGTLELIRKGLLAGTVTEDLAALAEQTARAAEQLITETPVEKECYVNYRVLTSQDLAKKAAS